MRGRHRTSRVTTNPSLIKNYVHDIRIDEKKKNSNIPLEKFENVFKGQHLSRSGPYTLATSTRFSLLLRVSEIRSNNSAP